MITFIPLSCRVDTTLAASGLIWSAIAIAPASFPSIPTYTPDTLAASMPVSQLMPLLCNQSRLPTIKCLPPTTPSTPSPGSCLKVFTSRVYIDFFGRARAASTIACATGWRLECSKAETMESNPSLDLTGESFATTISPMAGLPMVSVPVLSNTTVLTWVIVSNTSPPRTRIPCLAAIAVPTSTTTGVASPSAHGQATTNTLAAICKLSKRGVEAMLGTAVPLAIVAAADGMQQMGMFPAAESKASAKIFEPTNLQKANVATLAAITP
mmetsp:Transcript_250/g.1995  ORF Transcript_250/g.1995 Transcript_250/m.1995 type:complete len:268 (-) Transcript_250:1369-2172(-)